MAKVRPTALEPPIVSRIKIKRNQDNKNDAGDAGDGISGAQLKLPKSRGIENKADAIREKRSEGKGGYRHF
jgi:hypothetical protein